MDDIADQVTTRDIYLNGDTSKPYSMYYTERRDRETLNLATQTQAFPVFGELDYPVDGTMTAALHACRIA